MPFIVIEEIKDWPNESMSFQVNRGTTYYYDNASGNFTLYLKAHPNTLSARIFIDKAAFYGNGDEKSSFTNVKVKPIYQPEILLKLLPEDNKESLLSRVENEQPNITFDCLKPTKYRLDIDGAQQPYYLIFSETFHPDWRLFYKNREIATKNHRLVNGFANSWYITPEDSDGQDNYELVVEFWPQRLFYIGLGISFLTIISGLIYLVFLKLKRKKQ